MRIQKKLWMPVALMCMGGMMFVGCQNRRQKTHPYPPSKGFQQSPMRSQPGGPPGEQQLIMPPGNPLPPGGTPQGGSTSRSTPGQSGYPGGMSPQISGYRNVPPASGTNTAQPRTSIQFQQPNAGPVSYYKPNQNAPIQSPVGVAPKYGQPYVHPHPTADVSRPVPPIPGQLVSPRPSQTVSIDIPEPPDSSLPTGGTTVTGPAPAPSFPGIPPAPRPVTAPGFGLPSLP